MKHLQKHMRFPKDLIRKIEGSDKIPKYMDFTSKVFLLLEQALKEKDQEAVQPAKKKVWESGKRRKSA